MGLLNSVYQTNFTCTEIWTQHTHYILHVQALLDCRHEGVLPYYGTQEVPKHVGECVSVVFIFHCM